MDCGCSADEIPDVVTANEQYFYCSPPGQWLGQSVFATYQLVFRFLSPAVLKPVYGPDVTSPPLPKVPTVGASRQALLSENPGDTEQKQTDPQPLPGVIFLLFYYIIRLVCFFSI